jgi:hypothetical protein
MGSKKAFLDVHARDADGDRRAFAGYCWRLARNFAGRASSTRLIIQIAKSDSGGWKDTEFSKRSGAFWVGSMCKTASGEPPLNIRRSSAIRPSTEKYCYSSSVISA